MSSKNGVLTTFAKRVQELRKAKGWSQGEFAKKFGTSAAIAGRYERGDVAPSIEVARKIADVLGVTLDYLTDANTSLDSLRDQDMLDRLRAVQAMPEDDRNRILEVVDALIRDAHASATYSGRKRAMAST